MAGGFTVSAATNDLTLDVDRSAEVTFTVTNRTGHPVRARLAAVPRAETAGEWLTVARPIERDMVVDGSDQVAVDIAVPEGVPQGRYAFHLHVTSVTLPDEEWGDSPLVSFETPAAPPVVVEPVEAPGYVETLLGGLAGAAIVALLVAILGAAHVLGGGAGASPAPSTPDPAGPIDEIVNRPIPDICSTIQCDEVERDRCEVVACRITEIGLCQDNPQLCQVEICRIVDCPTAPPTAPPTPTPTPPDPGPPTAGLVALGLTEWLLPAVGAIGVLAVRGFKRAYRTGLPLALLMLVLGVPLFLGILVATDALRPDGIGQILVGVIAALVAVILPSLAGRAIARWRSVGHL